MNTKLNYEIMRKNIIIWSVVAIVVAILCGLNSLYFKFPMWYYIMVSITASILPIVMKHFLKK